MGSGLSKSMQEAGVEKIQEPQASPFVLEYADANSGLNNSTLTPGGIGTITGAELKFDTTNAAEGIFFVPTGGCADYKVAVLSSRTEGKIVFQVPPALVVSTYRLEVRRACLASKTIRTGELSGVLTVL
jgi:hypothetical protein